MAQGKNTCLSELIGAPLFAKAHRGLGPIDASGQVTHFHPTTSFSVTLLLLHNNMAPTDPAEEERIECALQDFYDGDYASIAKAAQAYGVKARTVQRRVQGTGSRYSRPVNNRALNLAQEQVLFDYIARLDLIGMHAKPGMLRVSANAILKLAHPAETRKVGES